MENKLENNDFKNITFDTLPAVVEVIIKTLKRLEAEIIDIKERLEASSENKNDDELLTQPETIALLKDTANTLHRWKRNGIIPYRKIGTKIYFKRSDLEEYNKIEIKKPRGLRSY